MKKQKTKKNTFQSFFSSEKNPQHLYWLYCHPLPRQANFAHGYRFRVDVLLWCVFFFFWSWFFCPWFKSEHVPCILSTSHSFSLFNSVYWEWVIGFDGKTNKYNETIFLCWLKYTTTNYAYIRSNYEHTSSLPSAKNSYINIARIVCMCDEDNDWNDGWRHMRAASESNAT